MSKSLDKYGFWGAPDKIKKLLEEEVENIPSIHFLFNLSKENVMKLLEDQESKKIVLLTVFKED